MAISFTVVISLATAWIAFSAFFLSFTVAFTPIDNVRKYDFIAGKWNTPYTAHFPRPIPADAQSVRFHYDPGALQAPSILELGYTTAPERIDALGTPISRLALV